MSASPSAEREGFIDVGAGSVWYAEQGTGRSVLLLHGGPGASSDYLKPLMALADEGYRVVRYDQLGSYRSDKPNDPELWVVPRFVEEVESVRSSLGLGKMHLIGQSWGSFLALEYALCYPDNLASIVLYSGAASTAQCVAGMDSLRNQLPADTVSMMREHEAAGTLNDPAYVDAIDVLYRRHLCRIEPYPADLEESMQHMALPVYESMWGPNEFTCTGNLMSWDRRDRLHEVKTPTLIVCGRYDEVIPECSETMHAGIVGSKLAIFEESSHLCHFEEPDRFWSTLRAFLNEVDESRAVASV